MAGSEIIFALNKIVKRLQQSTGRLRILYRTRMDRVLTAVDRGGSGADELLDEAVVRLGVTLAEDWKRRAI